MEKSGGGGGVRLHVGGLGESVGRDDLLKIFSPMGSVDAIEFVRTKGRSFAYIDFSPSSNNSLTKLFSTYNGCVWKGGRLRLEKAKEHYLARLKREWEEEASASDNTIKAPTDLTPSTHVNIFFPRLRKVKAMPLSGTGKHKYSFQRVPVPSLPKSFCDCEEHSNSFTPRETHVHDLEALNVGVNEEEVNVMNSVMNKLFQKNNIPSDEQVPEEDNEIEADQDNLIINVVSNGNDMCNSVLDMLSRKRKSILHEATASVEGYSEGRKGKHIHPSKKMKSIIPVESGRQESSQAIREKKKPSEVVPDKSSDEPSRTAAVKRSIDNISWSQKSSWKSLMANGNSSDFSVSSFLPGVGSSKAVPPASHNTALTRLPSQENSKKTKSKCITSSIIAAGDLPVSDDDIERNDSDAESDDDDLERGDAESDDDDLERGDAESDDDDLERGDAESDDDDLERGDAESDDDDLERGDAESDDDDLERGDAESDDDDPKRDDSDAVANDDLDGDDSDAVADDDLEMVDSDAVVDDIERDGSDAVANDDMDGDDSDAVANDDVERDDSDTVVTDIERDDSDTVENDTASDSLADDTASDAVGSETLADTFTDTNVETELLEGESGNGKLNLKKRENVAEDSSEEKESLVLKDNVVDKEKAGKELLKACNKSTGGSSWLQKASWTQLVSDTNTSSFSITQLFPDLDYDKGKAAKVINNEDNQYSNSNQSASGMKQTDYASSSSSGGFMAARVPVVSTPVRSLEENKQSLNSKNLSEGGGLGAKQIIRRKFGSGETRTFMRSSASLKEWAKAKKELSEPRRRRKSEE